MHGHPMPEHAWIVILIAWLLGFVVTYIFCYVTLGLDELDRDRDR